MNTEGRNKKYGYNINSMTTKRSPNFNSIRHMSPRFQSPYKNTIVISPTKMISPAKYVNKSTSANITPNVRNNHSIYMQMRHKANTLNNYEVNGRNNHGYSYRLVYNQQNPYKQEYIQGLSKPVPSIVKKQIQEIQFESKVDNYYTGQNPQTFHNPFQDKQTHLEQQQAQKNREQSPHQSSKLLQQFLLHNLTDPQSLTLKAGIVSIEYISDSTYIGEVHTPQSQTQSPPQDYTDHQKQGKGVYKYSNGDMYLGDWKADRFNGLGLYVFAHGGLCKGVYSSGKIISGVFVYPNLDRYEGQFRDGCRHGHGVIKYKSWENVYGYKQPNQNNEKNSSKKVVNDKDQISEYVCQYEGQWKQNRKNGWGKLISPQYTIEGSWQSDKLNGQVTITSKRHKLNQNQKKDQHKICQDNAIYFQYNGIVDGFQLVKGLIKIYYGQMVYYQGEIYRGKYNGAGKFVQQIFSSNGSAVYVYQGNFNQGKIQGKGIIKQIHININNNHQQNPFSIALYQFQPSNSLQINKKPKTQCQKQIETQVQTQPSTQPGSEPQSKKQAAAPNNTNPLAQIDPDISTIGTITYSNGDVYQGQIKHNLKHGYGQYRFSNGDLYQGQFHRDSIAGRGRYQWATGGHCTGYFGHAHQYQHLNKQHNSIQCKNTLTQAANHLKIQPLLNKQYPVHQNNIYKSSRISPSPTYTVSITPATRITNSTL